MSRHSIPYGKLYEELMGSIGKYAVDLNLMEWALAEKMKKIVLAEQ